MAQNMMLSRQFQPKDVLTNEKGKKTLTRANLRNEIKAHLKWCSYLGASVDEESLIDLSSMLRQTADVMHAFANLAEKHSRV